MGGQPDAAIGELADRFDMTLTGIEKHVQVLEDRLNRLGDFLERTKGKA